MAKYLTNTVALLVEQMCQLVTFHSAKLTDVLSFGQLKICRVDENP